MYKLRSFLLLAFTIAALAVNVGHAETVKAEIDGKPGEYHLTDHASQRWRLCAALPQALDHFFWAVAWGIVSQAKAEGVDVGIYQAGGYDHLDTQRKQVAQCLADGADVVLIASVDPNGFKDELALLQAHGVKVIDLLNGLHGDMIAAHAYENLSQGAETMTRELLKHAGNKAFRIAWFPGPLNTSWAAEYDRTLRKTLAADARYGKTVFLDEGGAGPTEETAQATLVREYAATHRADAIVGNAIAASFATRFYRGKPDAPQYIVATYSNENAIEDMKQGRLHAMLSVEPVLEARIAVDLAVRALEGKLAVHKVGISPRLITADNLALYLRDDPTLMSVSPAGIRMPLPQLPPRSIKHETK